jgi:hypothetical protein
MRLKILKRKIYQNILLQDVTINQKFGFIAHFIARESQATTIYFDELERCVYATILYHELGLKKRIYERHLDSVRCSLAKPSLCKSLRRWNHNSLKN